LCTARTCSASQEESTAGFSVRVTIRFAIEIYLCRGEP
jgi:hypothetical protein